MITLIMLLDQKKIIIMILIKVLIKVMQIFIIQQIVLMGVMI